jgi:hypothetical protein
MHVRLFAVYFCLLPLGATARSQVPVPQQPGKPGGNGAAETIVRRVDGRQWNNAKHLYPAQGGRSLQPHVKH